MISIQQDMHEQETLKAILSLMETQGWDVDIVITIRESSVIPNDLSADWVKEHMANTGEEISFF